jgi:hypothetical protein
MDDHKRGGARIPNNRFTRFEFEHFCITAAALAARPRRWIPRPLLSLNVEQVE